MPLTDEDRELLDLLIRAAVFDGINAYHAALNITPDHFAHLRREYEVARSNRQIVRKVLLGLVLGIVFTAGMNAATDWLVRKTSHAIDPRNYHSRPIVRPLDGDLRDAP